MKSKANWKDALDSMGAAINRITDDTTNYGGCCVVAAAIGLELEKRGIPAKVVVHGRYDIDEFRNKYPNAVAENWFNENDFKHGEVAFVVNGDEWIFDTDKGVRKLTSYQRAHLADGYLTPNEAHKLGKVGRWNSTFDRRLIPKIEKLISKEIQKLEI